LNEEAPLLSNEPADENIVGAPDWTKIEAEYRAGKPLRAISAQFRVGKSTISRKAKREGWQKSGTSSGQNAGHIPERHWKSDAVPSVSDDFDWDSESVVVLHKQPRTALYFNPDGDLVIRQQQFWEYEDTFVLICPEYFESFVKKLTGLVGNPSRK
jgi:hypothetical protein